MLRGIVENHRRGIDVFCDIVKPPTADHLAIAEDALASCHLSVKEFSAHRIPFAISPEGTAKLSCRRNKFGTLNDLLLKN